MSKKILVIIFALYAVSGFSQENGESSKIHLEFRSNMGLSTYTVYPYFPLKRALSLGTDLQVILGEKNFKFVAGIGYNRITLKHYPALVFHDADSSFIEGTWKRNFSFYTLNFGLALRPIRKIGLELRQVFGLALGYKIVDRYNYPDYDGGLSLSEKSSDAKLKIISSTSIDYFFPIKKFEIGVNITILKRFDKNVPMFNYGGGLILRYNIPNK